MIYILGAGAVGLALAGFLTREGRSVVAVRTSRKGQARRHIALTLQSGENVYSDLSVETVSLSELKRLEGIVVVAAKSLANQAIAAALKRREFTGPIVLLQNGLGVEEGFGEFASVYRGVLYLTSQLAKEGGIMFRQIASSPIGTVRGTESELAACVESLSTQEFSFHAEKEIRQDVWGKTIINAVFNSICPLLEIDNGIFARDAETTELARDLVRECLPLAEAQGILISESELMERILQISRGSQGQIISTLQDLRRGRPTEMDFINLALARMASQSRPEVSLKCTEYLGKLVKAKSRCSKFPDGSG